MLRQAALILVVSVLLGVDSAEAGPTLYVRTNGKDSADGLSRVAALRSIATAARRLDNSGGRIIVGPGVYQEGNISPRLVTAQGLRTELMEFIADTDGSRTGDLAGPVIVDAAGESTGFLLYGQQNIRIDGFEVRHAGDAGIQVRYNRGNAVGSASITIVNCIVRDSAKRGIDIQDTTDAVIVNNLVYHNGSSGISVGGLIQGSPNAVIAHNTSCANGDGGNGYGIFIGEGDRSDVASRYATVVSNVLAGNRTAGIKVAPESQDTYGGAFNVNADGFEPTTFPDPTDRETDPLLVNRTGAAADDFRLRAGSPAVDFGPADAATVHEGGSTRDDRSADTGIVDAGFHFDNTAGPYVVPRIPQTSIFVRTTGRNSDDGRTAATALQTIQHAALQARPGNRIIVGGGTYCEGDINLGEQTGTALPLLRPIEFVADADGSLTGDAGPVVIDAGASLCGGGGAAATGVQTGFDILGSSYVVIDGFHVTGGIDSGIQIRARESSTGVRGSDNVTVSNSVVFSNPGSGILVRDSANVTIFNNLVYANGTGGIAVGGEMMGSPKARVVNNTVYNNGAHGVVIGNRVDDDPVGSPGALVMNNLLDRNGGRALLVTPRSLKDFTGTANLDGALLGGLGLLAPAGADSHLGGAGFVDDDFHLQQRSAGQSTTSIAVDRSAGIASVMGLAAGSTRTDDAADEGLTDAGFHYPRGGMRPTVGTFPALQARLLAATASRPLFVNPDGNNGDGRSPASAFRTVFAAARIAEPGDTIVVAPGRYAEGDINLNNAGTASQPIVFVGDSSGKLTASVPGPVVIDATGKDTGFVLLQRSFVHIRGFVITGANAAAIQVRACAGSELACMPSAGSDHVTLADNVIFSGHRGIDVTDSTDATVFNNLIYANDSTGIAITGDLRQASDALLVNNTLYDNGGDAILLDGLLGAPNAGLINNIMKDNGQFGIKTKPSSLPGLVLSHNINRDGANSETPADPNDPGADPLFVRPSGSDGILGSTGFADDDFRLDVALSPGLDAAGVDATDVALTGGVARSDGMRDAGRADLGFHYEFHGPIGGELQAIVTLYVRAELGNDSNDGRTPQMALRTVARAAAQAGAGTTIVVGPGVYREGNLHPVTSGTASSPIIFVGDATGAQTGDAPGPVLLDANGLSGGFRLAGRSYVRIDGIDVTGARLAGVVAQNPTGVEVTNCRFFSNRGAGIVLVRPRGANTVFNNLVYANGGDGVQARLRRVRNSVLRLGNNTVYGNSGRGVWIDHSLSDRRMGAVLLAHNIVQNNAGDLVVTPRGWSALHLTPNLLSQSPTGIGSGAPLLITPSLFNAPAGTDSVLGGSGFADDDFRVDGGSAAIDAGSTAAIVWALDGRTVRRDNAADTGAIDLGYHYLR